MAIVEVMMKCKNVIFDFGGVLFEIDYHAPVREFRKLGFERFDEIYAQASQSDVFDLLETGKISNEDFYLYIESLCPPGTTRKQVVDAWDSILLHIMPEKVELVRRVKSAGRRTFLLSNTNAIHVASFEKSIDEIMGLANFKNNFEKIYYSNEIGRKKPYPETYLTICEWNGLNPAETLFIDDSIQHVEGAKKAGLQAVHLKPDFSLEKIVEEVIL